MSEQAGPGRPRNEDRERLQRRLDVGKRQANRMIKAGVDPEKIEDIAAVKLRKLQVETQKIEAQLAILLREYVSAAKVREQAHRAGASLQAALDSLDATLPGAMVGRGETQIREVWKAEKKLLLRDFCEELKGTL